MKYIKLYQNESDYITEIGENTEALLPNISFLGNGSVKFNPNPVREAYFKADYIDEPILSNTKRLINSIFSEMYLNDNEENLIKHNEIIEGSFTILPDTDLEYVKESERFYYWINTSKKSITTSSVESYIIECDEPLLDDYRIGISFAGGGGSGGSGGGFPPYVIAPNNTLYDFFSYEGLDINDYRIDEKTIDITTVLNMNFSSFGGFYVVIFKLDSDNKEYPINTHNHYKVEEVPEETFDVLNTTFVEGLVLDFKLECDVEILPTDILFYYIDGERYEAGTVQVALDNFGDSYGFELSEDRKSIVPNENYLPGYGRFELYGIMRDGEILTHECKILYMNDNFYVYPEKLGENKIRFVLKDRFAGIDYFANDYRLTRLNKDALVYNRTIPGNAYSWCTCLTSINIPRSVTSIGDYAFHRCENLTDVNISNGVTSIGNNAFYECLSLTNINIPSSVTSIGDYAFYRCYDLTDVNISNGVTSIGDYAFYDCDELRNINIPGSVTSIGDYAFYDCGRLTDVNISNGVTSIGSNAFYGCYNLTTVNISSSVTSIGWNAFYNCENLTDVNISNGVTSIGNNAFYGCGRLTTVNIPDSVTYIGGWAFCKCSGLTDVTISNSVTSIENGMFSACWSLTGVTIPSSVTSIGDSAFYNCSGLTSINIPSSVTSIRNSAFSKCKSLNSITCLATTAPSLDSSCFNGVSTNGVLKVPTGSNYSTWLSELGTGWTVESI